MATSTPKSSKITIPVFGGHEVRWTPDGRIVAVDVIRALGLKDPKGSWKHLKKQYRDLGEESSPRRFGRVLADTLSRNGLYRLILVAKGPHAERFRDWATDLIERFSRGDISLADEIVDRNSNPEDLERHIQRTQARVSNVALNATIKNHGGKMIPRTPTTPGDNVYAYFADTNNSLATGETARQLLSHRKSKGAKSSRDVMSRVELAVINLAQEAEIERIGLMNAQGNRELKRVCNEVVEVLLPVAREVRRPRELPAHPASVAEPMTARPASPAPTPQPAPLTRPWERRLSVQQEESRLPPKRTAEEFEYGLQRLREIRESLPD